MASARHDAIRDRIEAELTDPLRALGLDIEAVEITPAGKRRILRVAVDQDGGVTLDDVAGSKRQLQFEDVAKALVQIEFNRPGSGSKGRAKGTSKGTSTGTAGSTGSTGKET